MKQGEAVFLKFDPQFRGNISKVTDKTITVTWHRPSVDSVFVEHKRNDKRMRVTYRRDELSGIGFGVPSA